MGMAASQARYLSLFARKSNLEYQAQQINQERSVLSQQCTAMYNSLLAMKVPTPPSTSDYTTLTYSGIDGATKFTIGNVKPSGERYCIEIKKTDTGNALDKDYGTSVCGKQDVTEYKIAMSGGNTTVLDNIDGYFIIDANGEQKTLEESGRAVQNADKKWVVTLEENETLYQEGTTTRDTIGGNIAYNFKEAKELFPNYNWDDYEEAIKNSNINDKDNKPYKAEDFMVFFTKNENGTTEIKFALSTDVHSQDGFTDTYSFIPNGQFTESKETDGCVLEFDSQGMIIKIGIPNYDTKTNELLGYTYIDLTAEKTTDNAAYQDAYNEYEYAQYEYDKKQQEINAKTEVIQQQDRNLELKLQRLDTERQQITAEIDALKTVIKDNVDKSFKTFSG